MFYSNTTLVKVKSLTIDDEWYIFFYSNTTLVKVKLDSNLNILRNRS